MRLSSTVQPSVPSEPADTKSAPSVAWGSSTGYSSRIQEVREICDQGVCNHRQEQLGIFHFPSIMYREEAIISQKARSNKSFERLHRRNPRPILSMSSSILLILHLRELFRRKRVERWTGTSFVLLELWIPFSFVFFPCT